MSVIDSMTQKVMISDAKLRLFIPPQVWKMTSKLHQICGCEIYIIPKYMKIYLNRSRTRIVTDLQQKYVGRHTYNSLFLTTRDAYYKDRVFPYGGVLHATIKYEAQCTTCIPIKPKNMINIKCNLGFYDECRRYIIPD